MLRGLAGVAQALDDPPRLAVERGRAPGADVEHHDADRRGLDQGLEVGTGAPFGAVGAGSRCSAGGSSATPAVGVGLSDAGRELRVGWGVGLARREGTVSMDLEFEATRRESANDDREPEHGVGVRFSLRW